jgi:hypothetical protein
MITTAFINIWKHRAGDIAWDDSTGLGYFEFEPSFLKNNLDISPLKMPVSISTLTIQILSRMNSFLKQCGLWDCHILRLNNFSEEWCSTYWPETATTIQKTLHF